MKALFIAASILISSVAIAETNEYKTCTQPVSVEAVCAVHVDDHPIDPIVEPAFVYLSPRSYHKVVALGLNPKGVKDTAKVCESIEWYAIFDLFGDNRINEEDIRYDQVNVEFFKDCE